MQARILNKSEENLWDDFVKNHPQATIHQTSQWGHFQAKIPSRGKYWIMALLASTPEKSSTPRLGSTLGILAGTLLIRHSLPKGYCWLYAPRGPLLDYSDQATSQKQMNCLLTEIKKIAKQEKAVFLRIDPPIFESPMTSNTVLTEAENGDHLTVDGQTENNFKTAQIPPPIFSNFHFTKFGFQPQHTLLIDLAPTKEEILKQMKQKGRYNIRLAEKKGVEILQSDPANTEQFANDLADFYNILTHTTARDGFLGHNLDYYRAMLQELAPNNSSEGVANNIVQPSTLLYLAKLNGQTLAAAIVTYFRDTATYYYGASSNLNREVMAPYLLHWQIMLDAKKDGYKFYDLFGIAPPESKNHPWAKVTEFKSKFGGNHASYPPACEYGFKKLLHLGYKLYKSLFRSSH